jgi:hypothetical protein
MLQNLQHNIADVNLHVQRELQQIFDYLQEDFESGFYDDIEVEEENSISLEEHISDDYLQGEDSDGGVSHDS